MGGNLFEVVKESISAREAAQLYGIEVRRNGMACCPFHDDKNPSMKVDTRFHCFGCGADGDVIDFTSRLYDLSPKNWLRILALSTTDKRRRERPISGKNPKRRNSKRNSSTVSAFCLITTICSVSGKPAILPKPRRKNRTPALWRPFRKRTM